LLLLLSSFVFTARNKTAYVKIAQKNGRKFLIPHSVDGSSGSSKTILFIPRPNYGSPIKIYLIFACHKIILHPFPLSLLINERSENEGKKSETKRREKKKMSGGIWRERE
jgi:hypothetical protein